MKFRYQLINIKREVIFTNLEDAEISTLPYIDKQSMLVKISNRDTRLGVIQNEFGAVYAATSDKDYIKSSKSFIAKLGDLSNTLETFHSLVEAYKKQVNTNTSRLIHNLTTLNAHNIQEIYSLVPQDVLSSKATNLLQTVEAIIKSETRDTALAFLRIAKNNAAIKTEFAVFNKLFTTNPLLKKQSHNIHKVLMNVLYLFFPDFTDKHVKVNVNCAPNSMAFFDYESVHVALYHIFENSVKYVKPSTSLNIDITQFDLFVSIEIKMVSLRIDEEETETIFTDGYSGIYAIKTAKAGNGIGMTQVRDILKLNGASIAVSFDKSSVHEFMGIPYQSNVFRVKLNRQK